MIVIFFFAQYIEYFPALSLFKPSYYIRSQILNPPLTPENTIHSLIIAYLSHPGATKKMKTNATANIKRYFTEQLDEHLARYPTLFFPRQFITREDGPR